MDFLMELFFEVFLEGYVGMVTHFLPKDKMSPKAYKIIKVAVGIVSVLCFVALLFGAIALFSEDDHIQTVGLNVLVVAAAVTVVQIITCVIAAKKNRDE